MELTVAKKDLLRLVTRMQGVAERKSTMPALSNVLLTAEGNGGLRLAATDLYLAIAGRIQAEIKKGGSVAVPAKDLFERVKMMPEGPIHLTTRDNGKMELKAVGSALKYNLRTMPGDDFPPLPVPTEGAPTLALEVDVLLELIAKTHFSISTDETRAHLNSALFEWDGDVVRMVTTDGHRLSKMEVKVQGRQASATMLIPLKAIQELRRLCDDVLADAGKEGKESNKEGKEGKETAKPQLQITQSASSAFFQSGSGSNLGTMFSVKLVDAQFPPYSQVIPQNTDKKVKAPRTALANAMRAVSIAASERTGGVKLALNNGTLTITSESPESGEGADEVPVEYSGAGMTIGFNAKYFLDVLGALDEEDVVLSLSGELDPAVLRPDSERQFLAVVMPMRI